MNENDASIIKVVVAALFVLILAVIVFIFIDELQDGSGERECMSKIERVDPGENYNSVDCDL